MLVAIDTSTAYTGIACYDTGGLLGECGWYSGRDQTVQLLPQLDLLLKHLNKTPDQVTVVAIALGPGSWSGLRVGMSTAKGLALARDLALIGIGTLDALAHQHRRVDAPICPLIRLGRERFATATITRHLVPPFVSSAHNQTLPEITANIHTRTLFCGDLDEPVRAALTGALGDLAQFPTPAENARRAGFLAELAWQRWQAGDADNRATLEPIYLGHPVKRFAAS